MAAPCIPKAGAPRFPNISTQFKNTFVQNETTEQITDTRSTSMLLSAESIVLLIAKVKYAYPSILKYCEPLIITSALLE